KPEAAGADVRGAEKESVLKDAFFDFDKSSIRPDAKQSLDENAKWLKANPKAALTIEGHCDERGTREYNLGLGQRRAKAAKDYLVSAGIDAKRIKIISYGKERPFASGHDESAWKLNRRAHFVLQ
ncbi:MAG: Outer membrane lipoprotein omp16 precursor (peptidoglycan-associated lipoprotein) (modular protein), partial [candidate division NC10 bacterium]|nr:Outer membrane lipoprotein omp16 precursor (peptidoglycan-associated lipoprotein) (modular protein) [candidate division NC10 bacterium]